MATWQFSMYLVSRVRLLAVSPDLGAAFPDSDEDDDADPLVWTTTQPVADLAEQLSRVLPEVKSWSPTSRQWGSADQTTVQVSYTDGRVVGICARLDLREDTAVVIDLLASLATDSDGWWVGGDSNARVPVGQTSTAIARAIEGSDAARFVADPRAFLSALAARHDRHD